jgi:hypothetical protein
MYYSVRFWKHYVDQTCMMGIKRRLTRKSSTKKCRLRKPSRSLKNQMQPAVMQRSLVQIQHRFHFAQYPAVHKCVLSIHVMASHPDHIEYRK